MDLYRKLFNATDSIEKKEYYNEILGSVLGTIVYDSYYYNVDLNETNKFEFLLHFTELMKSIVSLMHGTRSILHIPANDGSDVYKKLYDINQLQNKNIAIINESIKKLITNLCKDKGLEDFLD